MELPEGADMTPSGEFLSLRKPLQHADLSVASIKEIEKCSAILRQFICLCGAWG